MKCAVSHNCGGCLGPHLSYRDHLAQKQREMEALLGRFCPVAPILGMEDPYHYRNKSIATFAQDRSGKLVSGIYAQGTHRVIPVEDCCLQMEVLNRTQAAVLSAARRCRLPAYQEDRGQGLLRHCVVRCDSQGQKALVTLVTPSSYFPGSRNFCKELTRLAPWVAGVVQSINPRATSAVLGKTFKTLWGKPFLEDTLLGLRFTLSSGSFYQVNPRQTRRLYETALDFAALDGTQTVLDAYCGIGTIGLSAAPRAGEVSGVELNPAAARDAAANARRNGAENARFYQGDATAWMEEQARRGPSPQVVILDPPRASTTSRFISAVQDMGPDRVVYVSCGPQTLARDLEGFAAAGYRPVKCQPVDMFPFTPHTEVVVLLEREKGSAPARRRRPSSGQAPAPL